MSPRPPVTARYVPPRAVLGVLARFAFWPVAFVGARALSPDKPIRVAFFLILASLVASTVSGARRPWLARAAIVGSGLIVAIPSFAAAGAAVATMFGAVAGVVLGVATALGAGGSFAQSLAVSRKTDGALDGKVLALVPVTIFLLIASLVSRYGGEAVHLHIIVATLARVMAMIAIVLALLAAVTLLRQLSWTRRVYQNEAPPLAISQPPDDVDVSTIPSLADIKGVDAVIASVPASFEPYRAERISIARVPAKPDSLLSRYRDRGRGAVAIFVVAVTTSALVEGSVARVAHAENNPEAPAKLPPLPGSCRHRPPLLRLVPLDTVTVVDIERIAARYRQVGINARVEAPLPFDRALVDESRNQLVGERVILAAERALGPRPEGELVVVVTDRDLFMHAAPVRYVFAYRQRATSVVSLARMDPSFPWLSPSDYRVKKAECEIVLLARAYKMITRALLTNVCGVEPSPDPRSVRRLSVAGLADLDEVDEATF